MIVFVTPYMRYISTAGERINERIGDKFILTEEWEIALENLSKQIYEEYWKCAENQEYSDAHYTTGPAVELIDNAIKAGLLPA